MLLAQFLAGTVTLYLDTEFGSAAMKIKWNKRDESELCSVQHMGKQLLPALGSAPEQGLHFTWRVQKRMNFLKGKYILEVVLVHCGLDSLPFTHF